MVSIELQDLVFERRKGFRLGPISLTLRDGSRTALVGPSGCGKTTLLRCLAGLETPGSGSIRIGDRLVQGDGVHVPADKRRIGFVFQDGALWPHKTAMAHLRFVAPRLSRKDAKALLHRVGLEGRERRRPAQLSGGERQRLALARALAITPDVLVLDEPLASVDVHLRDELALLVRRLTEERSLTLVVVTHDRDEALAMADDVVILREGHVVEQGAARDVLRAPRTSFAASFLCRASVWPAEAVSDERGIDSLRTPFGTYERNGAPAGPVSVVVLPGEARIAAQDAPNSARARVLRVLPRGDRALVTAEVAGRTIELFVDANDTIDVGDTLSVELLGKPRFLVPDRQSGERVPGTKKNGDRS
ncbi:MAG: ABC transporter ATP-binding protein [Planctomycetes bacterium]|nr:ABC transporter ATP-binding protein [Planctomycetota bacterium]MCB9918011.1 ABC transporter ATP-binding protein [Planctomycetota bacterium]